MASQQLKHYFEVHKVPVLTDYPLKNDLQRLDASERLLKWAVELSQYDFVFEARWAIKAQALADFLVENASTPLETVTPSSFWNLYVDGSSNKDGSGAGLMIKTPKERGRSMPWN